MTTLEQLSAAFTRLEGWPSALRETGLNNVGLLAADIEVILDAYRTGQLVEVQADDATVERVKDAIGTSLAYEIGMDVRAGSLTDDEKRKLARKAIAALKGPNP